MTVKSFEALNAEKSQIYIFYQYQPPLQIFKAKTSN